MNCNTGMRYVIKVKEKLETDFGGWFNNLQIVQLDDSGTLLTSCFPDQSALRGLVDQLWNLNMTIIFIKQVENEEGNSPSNRKSGE